MNTRHPHEDLLRALYTDFSQLGRYADPEMVLHQADRRPGTEPLHGIAAVLHHEAALVEATGATMTMDVQAVIANDHFGAVLAVLRATEPTPIAMPICGLWRFSDGRIVEHWENAHDPALLSTQLSGHLQNDPNAEGRQ